ncbi:MAG: cytochrome c oxidase subunit I [Chitinophagaceae bacterium]|nr:cytochrome c oxidase subunit I [Chitinophagaceae bacterium]
MFVGLGNSSIVKTTSYKVVLPFYLYAAISFIVASIFLLLSSNTFLAHYFQPHILAITHIMALGWGTMIILGASHQLVPVLIEGELYSYKLAHLSFILSAIGIPLLVYGFYVFDMGTPAKWGGRLVLLSILCYLINIGYSISKSKKENVHAVYVFTSVIWLFITVSLGLALVYNFTYNFLPQNSLHYLPLHVHTGILGWFLLLVIGVASRLIPMFLISKYTNPTILWIILWLINTALISFIIIFFYLPLSYTLIPDFLLFAAIVLFIYYCYNAYKQRIRKQVDEQVKLSLLSTVLMLLPILLLFIIIILFINSSAENYQPMVAYGFMIFFGWITAIILGMTFKTLPFIVWNKIYHQRSNKGKTPNPKDLFSNTIFKIMSIAYILGIVIFLLGLVFENAILLKFGAFFILVTSILYNWNVLKIVYHKPTTT